jgi:spore coat protein CotF
MMQERDIVNDILGGTKASINCYTTAIQECSNQQLRSTLQTLRNEAEQMQYQLYQIAEQKGYYTPAPTAKSNDINQLKTTLTSAVNSTSSANQMQ